MKKIIGSWLFIFLLSVLILLLILFYSIYYIETSPPVKGWSSAVCIAEIEKSMVKDIGSVKVTSAAIPYNNSFVTLWEVGNSLYYAVMSADGNLKNRGRINYKFPEMHELKAFYKNGNVVIYMLSGKELSEYSLNLKDDNISSKKIIENNVNTFTLKNKILVYSTDKYVKMLDATGIIHPISKSSAKILDVFNSKNRLFYILTTIENVDGSVDLNYATFNSSDNKIRLFKGVNIPIVHNYELTNSVISVMGGKISLLAGIREWETGETTTLNFLFPEGDSINPISSRLDLQGYNPNPLIVESGNNETKFIATTGNPRGFNTTNLNLGLFTIRNGEIIHKDFLTKTQGISMNPQMFKLGADSYLQWEDVGGSSKKIYFASTNKNVIRAARKISFSEFITLIIGTLTGTLWGFSFVLLMFTFIILPALLIILIISMLKLNWFENNTRWMLNICILLQLFMKIIFTLSFSRSFNKISLYLPSFLQHTPGMLLAVIITTCISAYCVKRRYLWKYSNESIIKQYMFFAVIDLILYSLIFYPYYAL